MQGETGIPACGSYFSTLYAREFSKGPTSHVIVVSFFKEDDLILVFTIAGKIGRMKGIQYTAEKEENIQTNVRMGRDV